MKKYFASAVIVVVLFAVTGVAMAIDQCAWATILANKAKRDANLVCNAQGDTSKPCLRARQKADNAEEARVAACKRP